MEKGVDMTEFLTINGNRIEIEEPEINKMYQELTRLITISQWWEDKQCSTLMRICLKARDRRKMIYGHPAKGDEIDKRVNMFYTNGYEKNHYSVFITGVGVEINDVPTPMDEAYIKLLYSGVCSFKKNNPFGVVRKGNPFSGYSYHKTNKVV